jgi:HlyD family secretion protein
MTANIIIYTKEDSNAMIISVKALKFTPDPALANQFKILALNIDSITKVHAVHHQRNLSDTSKNKVIDSTGAIIPKMSFVWVKQSDSLIQRKIKIGLNDDTNVQILEGLSINDTVVDDVIINVKTDVSTTGAAKSPFMPKMGGGKKP